VARASEIIPGYREYFCNTHKRWLVDVTDHPLFSGKRWVHRARVVVAQILERELHSWEIVHHLDENPDNDNWENLEVITRAEHLFAHDPYQFVDGSKLQEKARTRCTEEWRMKVSARVKQQHAEGDGHGLGYPGVK